MMLWLSRPRLASLCLSTSAACLIPLSTVSAETNAELLDRIEEDTDRWIELQSVTAKENAQWQSEKELLAKSIDLLNTERSVVEKNLESNRLASELYVNNEASLSERISEQEAALAFIGTSLSGYGARVASLIPRLPAPIKREAENLAAKVNAGGESESETVASRVQSLISLLTLVDQFNNSITMTHEIRQAPNGDSIDTRVMYWGLSAGFAVDAAGRNAWLLSPGSDGWNWESDPEQAESIEALMEIYENERSPTLVPLPITLGN